MYAFLERRRWRERISRASLPFVKLVFGGSKLSIVRWTEIEKKKSAFKKEKKEYKSERGERNVGRKW